MKELSHNGRNAPVLGEIRFISAENLVASSAKPDDAPFRLRVVGGLNYLQGNALPHFSITGEVTEYGRKCEVGCLHERITELFGDRFKELMALHLSDINGAPIYAEANGWYWLVGALPEYAADESLAMFARHCRISFDEARQVADTVTEAAQHAPLDIQRTEIAGASATGTGAKMTAYDWKAGRRVFAEWIESQRPRWSKEAKAAIERFGLQVFGDPWEEGK